jgi:hypothetical protein
MAKPLPENLLSLVQAELAQLPAGARIDELATRLAAQASRRSLQRMLATWTRTGQIRAEGVRKGRRYFLVAPPSGRFVIASPQAAPDQNASFVSPSVAEPYVPLSVDGRHVRDLVQRPIIDREPVGYQREFLDRYEPNRTAYLPETVVTHLHRTGSTPNEERPAGTFAREMLNRLLIDLSWASSRLEGNTYSLLDTQRLIEAGEAAPGKDAKETQMIVNHKAAIEFLVDAAQDIGVNRFTILSLHTLLADNLLSDPRQTGRLREGVIGITASTYIPTAIPQLIDELFRSLLVKAAAIRDPFEQSFFLMVQLPYLQPFIDVNKRTSRLAANIPLIRHNLVPLSFVDVPERAYIDGLIGVYEANRIELLRDVFVWAYERSCLRYKAVRDSVPEPDPFLLRYRAALTDVVGQIVRQKLSPTLEQVAQLATPLVDTRDLQRFSEIAIARLLDLHEGNIARYRLRPSELLEWQSQNRADSRPR